MKKSLTIALSFVLGAFLITGSFSGDSFAKGTKKKVAQTTTKATSPTKATSTAKTKTAPKTKTITASVSDETDILLKRIGTSQAEIQAQIRQGSASSSPSAPATGEQINWQVISGGGGSGSSTNFGLISVIGQTAVGSGSSTNFNLSHGFLQSFASAGCCATPGDFNNDATFNIADVTSGIARIFSGGPAPICQDQADANGDNTFNIADVTFGIARIFSGGPAPICGTTGT